MNKLISTLIFLAVASVNSFAQTNDGIKRYEAFIGYSFSKSDTSYHPLPNYYDDRSINHHGFNVSAVYNVSRYFGVKADVSGVYNGYTPTFLMPTDTIERPDSQGSSITFGTFNSLYNFLGGVQVKDNVSNGRIKPFIHALIGAANKKNTTHEYDGFVGLYTTFPVSTNDGGFAGAFGGGLDIQVGGNIAIRAFQVDYNPAWFKSGVNHNMRLSMGIVF